MESSAPLIAIPPNSGACKCDNLPVKAPIGVLLAATI
jgi:hypothetical protein